MSNQENSKDNKNEPQKPSSAAGGPDDAPPGSSASPAKDNPDAGTKAPPPAAATARPQTAAEKQAALAAAEAALLAFEHSMKDKPASAPAAISSAPVTSTVAQEKPGSSRAGSGPAPSTTPQARPPVVRFSEVTKTYAPRTAKAFTAIKDVSFVVEDLPHKGEFICLLGPSGCGKSTVLRLIAGLEPQHPPTTGRVEVLGQPVAGPSADRGMVFQSYTSFDHRTVERNVAFGLECRGMPKKERLALAREWIGKVGLSVENDASKYPHQLSGGMQQRVAIARTLILKPRIILMDEPFGALDPITRSQMQDLVVSLWREVEATVFFITHSIEEAVYLSDRVYLFSNSPGTILRTFSVPPPDRPSMEMQRDPAFQEVVFELRDLIDHLEHEQVQAREAAAAKKRAPGKRAAAGG